jgi:hypothetical protein
MPHASLWSRGKFIRWKSSFDYIEPSFFFAIGRANAFVGP